MNRNLLRSKNYRAYVTAGITTSSGTWIQKTALGWYLFEQTGSAASIAMLAVADAVPSVLFCLHAGWLADRVSDKLKTWRALYLLQGLVFVALALALLMAPTTYWPIFVAIAVSSTLQTLHGPLAQVSIRSCFTKEDQSWIASTNSVINNVARFLGAWAGAALFSHFGIQGVVAINAVSFVVPYILFRQLAPIAEIAVSRPDKATLLGGMAYAAADSRLSCHFTILIVTCLFGRPIVEQAPAIAKLANDASINGVAQILSAVGVGALLAALILPRASSRFSSGLVSIAGGGLIAAGTLGVAALLNSSFQAGAFALLGFGMVTHGVGMIAFIQETADSQYLGRIFSMFSLTLRGGVAVGALFLGFLSDHSLLLLGLYGSVAAIAVVISYLLIARSAVAAYKRNA